jgi:hypothetical protein
MVRVGGLRAGAGENIFFSMTGMAPQLPISAKVRLELPSSRKDYHAGACGFFHYTGP